MMTLGIMSMIIGFIIFITFFIVSDYYRMGVSIVVILVGIAFLVIGFITLMVGARKS